MEELNKKNLAKFIKIAIGVNKKINKFDKAVWLIWDWYFWTDFHYVYENMILDMIIKDDHQLIDAITDFTSKWYYEDFDFEEAIEKWIAKRSKEWHTYIWREDFDKIKKLDSYIKITNVEKYLKIIL